VICSGKNDYVYAYKQDIIKNCAHVYYYNQARDRKAAARRAAKMTGTKSSSTGSTKRR
jgi:hypothetical protein